MNLLPILKSDHKIRITLWLLLVCTAAGTMACNKTSQPDKAVRVAFAEAYNKTMKQENTGCSMKLEGFTAQRALLDCPEVEEETVARMVEVMCKDMAKIGFGKVVFSSEAEGGTCSVKRCTCKLDSTSPEKKIQGTTADAGDMRTDAGDAGAQWCWYNPQKCASLCFPQPMCCAWHCSVGTVHTSK